MRPWLAFAQAIALAGLASAPGSSTSDDQNDRGLRFDPAHMRSPPEVEEASIQVLLEPVPEGNARLLVRFKERPARQGIVIEGGAGPTALRDDGAGADERADDGLFSAFVNFDAEEYEAEQERRSDVARRMVEVPVFKNRVLVDRKRLDLRAKRFPPGEIVRIDPFDGDPDEVDPARELMITDLGVVEDPDRTFNPCTGAGTPMGAWTFGRLMTEMANERATGIDPSDFTLHWLQHWNTDLTINSFTVFKRSFGLNERILGPWPKMADGRLDLAKAPFRLLAIVNRIDLRGSTAFGSGDAGEARLVFGLLICNPTRLQHEVQQFTVNFEYGIRKHSCAGVRHWARRWHALGSFAIGSPAYNAALQAITDRFTRRNADRSKRPNRSALSQLRTNEFALVDIPFESFWELREFRICGDAGACALGQIEETTVAQTPDASFQGVPSEQPFLRDFVNANESDILAGKHTVPLQLPPSIPFRGGAIQPGGGFGWNPGGITNPEARHAFSLATCNGCHTAETGTHFVQISPRNAGSPSVLSDFLTGLNQPKIDRVSGVPRTFHELLERQMKLDAAVNMSCGRRGFAVEDIFPRFVPRAFVH